MTGRIKHRKPKWFSNAGKKTEQSTKSQDVGDGDQKNGEENSHKKIQDFATKIAAVITNGFLIKFLSIKGISLFFYVATWINDIYLICNFTIHKDYWYSSFVVVFWVNAALPIGSASYSFYNKNGDKEIPRDFLPPESFLSWLMKWVCHFILLGLFPRYFDIFKYVWKGKFEKNDDKKKIYLVAMIWEDAELINLSQSFCFMKTASHLTLKLYIILKDKREFGASSMILPILSVIGLSLALVSYDKNICFMKGIEQDAGDKNAHNESNGITIDYNMSETAISNMITTNWTEMTCQLFAQFFWIVSRLIALCLFAIGYGWIIWLACFAHLIVTFIWHLNKNYWTIDAMRLSFLHLFAYLYPLANGSDKLKHPRLSPAIFQSVCFFENICLMFMWTVSLKVGDGTLHHGISSVLSYPWNEWTFLAPWIVQLTTMALSCFLFRWFNKKRQDNHNHRPSELNNFL